MRAAELLGRRVLDRDGGTAGRILDIRITRAAGTPDPGRWHIAGVVIGHRWSFARAGYAYGSVAGPALMAALLRWFGRHLRYAEWHDLTVEANDATVTLRARLADLPHPKEV